MTFPSNRDADRVACVYRLGTAFLENPPTEAELLARIFGDGEPSRRRLMLGEWVGVVLVALGSASLVLLMLGVPWAPTPHRALEVWRCWRRR
ncbi:hypothetical protein [Kitasatospora sp. NPDC094011]|uniref:hypothetical protein n=1 Tax=Kitasatospora sp. NPDC094011 TaxID=3364090 RepID=UPI0037F51817